ncbi:23S rRNA (uracil1939-C5)-methyltransferase [Thermosyntropha lipolytica DSM 11003]|uniref:23S rRNA (Uracil1939-C5)-methyltransferase n=1 Tax=Thermosyntropha lipolytica DSM 11003 TaxID=1123382 RepID=A0A1M5L7Y0_9FIRM|nr:23S rRNA (uracil(1939)-C(5))-methyltransferase RlmD [Thermosyntropha lipolytica]SHG61224.1 23S rRNA (uracil1939-C5)-methyltransferase [Thermosyntropha lipolytica DSM 11003]
MQARIDGITHKGEGVARINGKAVFIPFALPGEEVELDITEEKKNYAYGRLEKIIHPSPARTTPLCSHYYTCGGCSFQHVDYEEELQLKKRIVTDAVTRIGKIEARINEVERSSKPYRYRNKVTWHVAKGRLGYYRAESRELVPIDDCLLIKEDMAKISRKIGFILKEIAHEGQGEIIVRQSSYNGKIMLICDLPSLEPEKILSRLKEDVDGIYIKQKNRLIHFYGDLYLEEKIGANIFRLSPGSFFQVNQEQNEKIISFIQSYLNLTGKETLLDAYCGVGSIGISLAGRAAKVLGIENNREAVKNAEYNAHYNRLNNCRFLAGDCEKILPVLNEKFDMVIVDPPRSGLKKEVIASLIKAAPQKIAYVSCNPATLARDLNLIQASGYIIEEIKPFDMFSKTYHVECVAGIRRID